MNKSAVTVSGMSQLTIINPLRNGASLNFMLKNKASKKPIAN
ncbi:hypothetical protein CHCC14557_3132 [Bacillus licheniformis]|nr:hypothetical protein CHCC14557_3132 [Bacillus licheniformis]